MLNPYLLLAALTAWLTTVAGSYMLGRQHMEDSMRAAQQKEQTRLIEEYKQNALADTRAFIEAERKHAAHQQQMLQRKHALELDLTRRAQQRQAHAVETNTEVMTCSLDEDSFKLLTSTITDINEAIK